MVRAKKSHSDSLTFLLLRLLFILDWIMALGNSCSLCIRSFSLSLNVDHVRKFEFLYLLIILKDDPKECKVADCTKSLAEEMCPKTCSEQKICKVVDCTKPESITFCPKTCAKSSKIDIGKKNERK